eukprot:5420770-Pyramimonas_sp.AAC.1
MSPRRYNSPVALVTLLRAPRASWPMLAKLSTHCMWQGERRGGPPDAEPRFIATAARLGDPPCTGWHLH